MSYVCEFFEGQIAIGFAHHVSKDLHIRCRESIEQRIWRVTPIAFHDDEARRLDLYGNGEHLKNLAASLRMSAAVRSVGEPGRYNGHSD